MGTAYMDSRAINCGTEIMGKLINMIGRSVGRLTVIARAHKEGDTRAYWRCVCECGGETVASGKDLRSGNTRSCGCLGREWSSYMGGHREFVAKRIARTTRHGHKRVGAATPEYKAWLRIKSRCNRKSDKDYPNWGGRGIKVCEAWSRSFEQFLSDMGPIPSPRHQIDRIDPNGNYEPDNCRWVTPSVQAAENRRTIKPVTVNGAYFPSVSAASRHFGVLPGVALLRIRSGIPPELAVSLPARGWKPRRTRESYLRKDHPDRSTP